jgi:GTP-binding nuclear protein Ran
MNTYKIMLIGDGGVGKDTYARKLQGFNFEKKYLPTMGVEVLPTKFNTNYGEYKL